MTTNTFAVAGASDNPEKYGYKVYQQLKAAGYTVWPVNPHAQTVQGDQAYPTLASLPAVPTVVNIVTPPAVSRELVEQAATLGAKVVWLQPGAADNSVVQLAHELQIGVIHDQCVLQILPVQPNTNAIQEDTSKDE